MKKQNNNNKKYELDFNIVIKAEIKNEFWHAQYLLFKIRMLQEALVATSQKINK